MVSLTPRRRAWKKEGGHMWAMNWKQWEEHGAGNDAQGMGNYEPTG